MIVLIADDQADVRSALKILLEQDGGIDVTEEAGDPDSLLSKAEKSQPDLLLLDWELSGRPMTAFIPVLKKRVKGLRIVAMSVCPEAAKEAMEAGADAFVSKGDNSDKLRRIIESFKKSGHTGQQAR